MQGYSSRVKRSLKVSQSSCMKIIELCLEIVDSIPKPLRRFFPNSGRTCPPVYGRQHSTARVHPGGLARRTRAERCDMNRCRWQRCGQNALFRRIWQSTCCQQKEQLMLWLLSAVTTGNQAEMILDDRTSDNNHRGEERVLRRVDITDT
jgi:hypothetical protein